MKKAMILLLAMLLSFTLSGIASPTAESAEYKEYRSADFTYPLDQSGNAEITDYYGKDRDLRVPSEIDGHPVTSIGQWAFGSSWGSTNYPILVSVTLPEGLQSIGDGAFDDCSELTSVTLPEGLQSLGGIAFRGCSSLTSVLLPDSLVSMSGNPFAGFSDLSLVHVSPDHPVFALVDGVLFNQADKILVAYPMTTKPGAYQVPSGTRAIGNDAFGYWNGLTSIVLPEGLESIGDRAFFACRINTHLTLPEGLRSIGDSAFYECVNLPSVTLPKSLESIGDSAFNFCRSLTSVVVPEGVKSVGFGAFGDCQNLTSVTLPASLVDMEWGAFWLDFETMSTNPALVLTVP